MYLALDPLRMLCAVRSTALFNKYATLRFAPVPSVPAGARDWTNASRRVHPSHTRPRLLGLFTVAPFVFKVFTTWRTLAPPTPTNILSRFLNTILNQLSLFPSLEIRRRLARDRLITPICPIFHHFLRPRHTLSTHFRCPHSTFTSTRRNACFV